MADQRTDPTQSVRTLLVKNIVWVMGIIPVTFASIRIVVVARGDPNVMKSILSNLDFVQLLLGTLLPLLPAYCMYGAVFIVRWYRGFKARDESPPLEWFYLAAPMGLLLVLTALSQLGSIVTAAGPLIVLGGFQINAHFRKKKVVSPLTAIAINTLVLQIIFSLSSNSMWLPSEKINYAGGSQKGYVISSDVRWTTVLTSESKIAIISTQGINERTPCVIKRGWSTESIPSLINKPTPLCK